jgi:DNA-binding MarR family transcriptional regulator
MSDPPYEWSDRRQDDGEPGVLSLVFQLSRRLATALEREVAPFGVTAQQAALLLRVCATRGASPSQLVPRLGTDTAGLTRLVDRLEAKGLVARGTRPGDRRGIVIEPTEAGRALAPRLLPAMRYVSARCLAGFSAEESALLKTLLHRALDNAAMDEHGPSDELGERE